MQIPRKFRNRSLRVSLIVVLLVGAAAGFTTIYKRYVPEDWMMLASRDAGLVLEQVRLSGTVRTDRDQILSLLDVEDGSPLIDIDIADLKARLETVAWVKEARVSRVFPNEIAVDITERKPFALWQKDGVVSLIDEDGYIITREGLDEFAGLLLLVGSGAEQEGKALTRILEGSPELKDRVASAVRFGARRWDVIMDNGIRVKLPAADGKYGPKEAWMALHKYEQGEKILDRELLVIDLRIEDRLVVRLSDEGQKAIKANSQKYGA